MEPMFVFASLGGFLVLGFFGYRLWRTFDLKRTLVEEAAARGIERHVETGGVRLGLFLQGSHGTAVIAVDALAIHLVAMGRLYVFHKPAIHRLCREERLLRTGLLIDHKLRGVPAYLVFWPVDFRALCDYLERHGWVVDD